MINLLKYIVLFLLVLSAKFLSQNLTTSIQIDTFNVSNTNKYRLSSNNIIPLSEIIYINNKVVNRKDYDISYFDLSFSILKNDTIKYFDKIIIQYETINNFLQSEYKNRSLVYKYSKNENDTILVIKNEKQFSSEKIFGSDINKSGSISRGFTIGSNKDLVLNSGLRLNLNGNIGNDIEIIASLTDENVPIQPEGNTETLNELDKVFIQLKKDNTYAVFGDYDFNKNKSEFSLINRKLQGAAAYYNNNNSQFYAAIAGAKGKFNSMNFNGIEGIQGPYKLFGESNERDIIIVAGSEKVFIDGIEIKRGENNEYTIDYSLAEITFTPNIIITSNTRIIIEFEYNDRNYNRNFYAFGADQYLYKNFKIGINYFREGDDKNSPLDIVLSDDDKRILNFAGDNDLQAYKSGITLAQVDSNGIRKGLYTKIDTIINDQIYSIYKYDPNNSEFNIRFTFIGEKKGDYIKDGLGNYRFVGIGEGNYLPVIKLPLPELQQNANVNFHYSPTEKIDLLVDIAGSNFDKNTFSNLDDANNNGFAGNLEFKILPIDIKFSEYDLGKLDFNFKERVLNRNYNSLDRIDQVEFERNYNTGSSDRSEGENLSEFKLNYKKNNFAFQNMYGKLKRGGNINADRYNSVITLNKNEGFNGSFNYNFTKTKLLNSNSKFIQNYSSVKFITNYITPELNFRYENRNDKNLIDSLSSTSFEFYEINPAINVLNIFGMNFITSLSFRTDKSPINNEINKESNSLIQSYQLQYQNSTKLSSSINLVIRNKKYTDEFKFQGLQNNKSVLIKSNNRFNLINNNLTGRLFYETTTQRISKFERIFIRVSQGTGNYKYIGDLNNNGIAEENEFEFTQFDGDFISTNYPTENYIPVIDVKAFAQWKIKLNEIFSFDLLDKLFHNISYESLLRVDENSKNPIASEIYLLDFSKFQNAENTIKGNSLILQDLNFWENSKFITLRLRYNQSRSLFQFNSGVETNYNRERSIKLKSRLVEEIRNETEVKLLNENVMASGSTFRNRILNTKNISTDFTYIPYKYIEAGLNISISKIIDYFPQIPVNIDQNMISLRIIYTITKKGRIRFEVERNELVTNSTSKVIPFEITKGYKIGQNYIGKTYIDYKLGNNLQTSIYYEARSLAKSKLINSARAEVKAYF